MEEIKINKNDLLKAYSTGNTDQKAMLEKLYGKEMFTFDYREITSYEKACEVLGIQQIEFKEVGDRPQYMKILDAVHKLLIICEAINGNGKWYDNTGLGYCPAFFPYTEEEMLDMGESVCKSKGIHQILTSDNAAGVDCAGISFACVNNRCKSTNAYTGFPICLNSEEKAEFVGKQFFELCCQCYGINVNPKNK